MQIGLTSSWRQVTLPHIANSWYNSNTCGCNKPPAWQCTPINRRQFIRSIRPTHTRMVCQCFMKIMNRWVLFGFLLLRTIELCNTTQLRLPRHSKLRSYQKAPIQGNQSLSCFWVHHENDCYHISTGSPRKKIYTVRSLQMQDKGAMKELHERIFPIRYPDAFYVSATSPGSMLYTQCLINDDQRYQGRSSSGKSFYCWIL